MSTFPSVISTFTDPQATNRLNSPSHSAIEVAQNANLTAIENFIGVEGANSTLGTLVYDIRSRGSNGGGHVQTAALGGTGQTTYIRGELLVAQSDSVLSRLGVGSDGQILVADHLKTVGMQWVDNPKPKVAVSASVITVLTSVESSIVSTTIPGSTLSTSNAIKAVAYITDWQARSSMVVRATFGGTVVASVLLAPAGAASNIYDNNKPLTGEITYTLIENATTNSQRAFLGIRLNTSSVLGPTSSTYQATDTNVSSLNGNAPQSFGITIKESTPRQIEISGYVVEKIS